jgi:hypothetical protein
MTNLFPTRGTERCERRSLRSGHASNHLLVSAMRRAIAVLLGIFLFVPVAAESLTLANDSLSQTTCTCVGVCHCRYCKMHHHGTSPADNAPAFSSPGCQCPCGPGQVAPQSSHSPSLTPSSNIYAEIVAHPVGRPQTLARQRVSSLRSRQKRGPPAVLLF